MCHDEPAARDEGNAGAPGFALSASLAALAGFLAGALVLTAAPPGAVVRDGMAALLAVAMGIQNAVARRLAVPDLTTTVLTMTLTGIAADVRSKDHGRGGLDRRVLAVVTMLAGGAVGALLVLHVSTAAALGLAAGALTVVTGGAALAARHPGAWREGHKG